jgi:hypothetical protein
MTNLTRFADTVKAWKGILADTAAADPSGPVDFTMPSLGSFMQV